MTSDVWTPENTQKLKILWQEGRTAAWIARALGPGVSRCAVLGKVYRLGLARGREARRDRATAPRCEVMARVSADLGEPDLRWVATCHYDTDQPHAQVLVRGRRADGRDLVIPRDYMGYGFRARAQEVTQERLGDLSRVEAERRVWKETQADRFTGLDKRLLAAADADGMVDDGAGGTGAWAALSRGRLRYLEGLGLAVRTGRRYRLDPEMEMKLRTLQVRRDIIRTMNQRRLEGAREVRLLGREKVAGVVVKTGFHDEAGAAPWLVVRDAQGVEHYGRLKVGGQAFAVGDGVALAPVGQGMAVVVKGRSLER
jgi:hypothetical protein